MTLFDNEDRERAPLLIRGITVRIWMVALVLAFLFIWPLYAQLQTSGNVVQIGGALPAGSNTVGGVNVMDAGGVNKLAINTSGQITVASIASALPAGTNVLGVVNTIPKTACGNAVASQALVAVPTSSTAVFTATTCLVTLVLNNTTGSALTVTVSDNQATPVNDVLTFSIPAFSQLIQPLHGVAFTSGVKWSASGSGVTGAMLGYQ